jgi:hypothetical protein
MSIADNIEKEFAKLLCESRSAARHKLVAEAADKEDAIRAKRPRKEKNKKSVIEEAHPEEVFVAESDGLGGRVGNPEQVQEQIIDALNRRPSAFPYQGLVANAMADFEKTAEVLESHDLFNEAAAVRKVAADWLAVLERRGNLKKKAAVPEIIDYVSETAGSYGSTASQAAGDYGSTSSSTIPPASSSNPPPSGGVGSEDAPPSSASASAEAAADTAKAAEKADQAKTTTAIAKVTEKVEEANDAAKAIAPLEAAKDAATKAGGKLFKALSVLGPIFDVVTIGARALDKDWTSTIGLAGAGAVGAAAAVLGAPATVTAGAIIAGASTGIFIYDIINETLLGAWQENFKKDVADATEATEDLLRDQGLDPERREAAERIRKELESISKNMATINQQASLSGKANMSIIATSMTEIDDSIAVANRALEDIKEKTTFDVDVRQVIAAMADVEDSKAEFDEELGGKLDSKWPEVKALMDAIRAAAGARKSALINANFYSSGGGSAAAAGSQQSAASPVALSSDDPDHVKEVQAAINDFQASDAGFNPKLALTGKWDAPTMEALRAYVRLWLRVDTNLAQVISVDSLKKSTGDVIKDVNDLYRNKEAEIAAIMRGSANK